MRAENIKVHMHGAGGFRALWAAVSAAQETVDMAFWLIEAEHSPAFEGKAEYGPFENSATWTDLICYKLERGVRIRILLSDFDPYFAKDYHARTWKSLFVLSDRVARMAPEAQSCFAVIASQHPAPPDPWAWPLVHPLAAYFAIRDAFRQSGLRAVPGRWQGRGWQQARAMLGLVARPPFFPGTHHEKLCLVDGNSDANGGEPKGFIGGLDLGEARDDEAAYSSDFPWLDSMAEISGPIIEPLQSHMNDRWKREAPSFIARLRRLSRATRTAEEQAHIKKLQRFAQSPSLNNQRLKDQGPRAPDRAEAISSPATLLRTYTPRALTGRQQRTPADTSVYRAYRNMFEGVEEELILINQFFRYDALVDLLLSRLQQRPALKVVLLISPGDETSFRKSRVNRIVEHANAIQLDSIKRLLDVGPEQVRVLTMAQHAGFGRAKEQGDVTFTNPQQSRDASNQPQAAERTPIYVHSKIALADGRLGIIGSANLNKRSMALDTETALMWDDVAVTQTLRDQLMEMLSPRVEGAQASGEVLGQRVPADHRAALGDQRNKTPKTEAGQGLFDLLDSYTQDPDAFVTPYPVSLAERLSKRFFMPVPAKLL